VGGGDRKPDSPPMAYKPKDGKVLFALGNMLLTSSNRGGYTNDRGGDGKQAAIFRGKLNYNTLQVGLARVGVVLRKGTEAFGEMKLFCA